MGRFRQENFAPICLPVKPASENANRGGREDEKGIMFYRYIAIGGLFFSAVNGAAAQQAKKVTLGGSSKAAEVDSRVKIRIVDQRPEELEIIKEVPGMLPPPWMLKIFSPKALG